LNQLKQTISKALEQTAPLFEPVAIDFDWVHQAATILDNDLNLSAQDVRQCFEQLLQTMETCKEQATSLASGVEHFLKVTLSYAPGLFHCYDIKALPRASVQYSDGSILGTFIETSQDVEIVNDSHASQIK
jgi:hypothetical protein